MSVAHSKCFPNDFLICFKFQLISCSINQYCSKVHLTKELKKFCCFDKLFAFIIRSFCNLRNPIWNIDGERIISSKKTWSLFFLLIQLLFLGKRNIMTISTFLNQSNKSSRFARCRKKSCRKSVNHGKTCGFYKQVKLLIMHNSCKKIDFESRGQFYY